MTLDLRPLTADDLPALLLADEYGFGHRPQHADDIAAWAGLELDRALGVFEGADIVATGRAYTLALTLPGGSALPVAGISWVSVRPTHRRRGLLTAIMSELLGGALARGESAAVLTASEGGIYGRFGFGVAARARGLHLDLARTRFAGDPPAGRLRLVEPADAAKIAAEVFDASRASWPGMVSRPSEWWESCWVPRDEVETPFVVVYERDGRAAGLALYELSGDWSEGSVSKRVSVRDLLAIDPVAEAALWRYLCSVDLTVDLVRPLAPVDLELPHLLADARQVRTTSLRDMLWLRPLDVEVLLAARGYEAEDDLVLEVRDPGTPPRAAGTFLVEARREGARCSRTPASSRPDLVMGPDVLAMIVLGDTRPSVLARAGRLDARDAAVLARADRVFMAERLPFCGTWF